MTDDEINTIMNGLMMNMTDVEDAARVVTDQELRDLPDHVDWRDKVYAVNKQLYQLYVIGICYPCEGSEALWIMLCLQCSWINGGSSL